MLIFQHLKLSKCIKLTTDKISGLQICQNPEIQEEKMTDLSGLIHTTCEKFAKRNAFMLKENKKIFTVTFEDFEKRIIRTATGLKKRGITDCNVIISGKNSYEWVVSFLSAIYAGCVVVPLDASLPAEEYSRIVKRSDAKAILFSPDIEEKCLCQETEIKIPFTEIESLEEEGNFELPKKMSDDLAIILFTSGTTANSKAVMLSHKNFVSNVESLSKWEDFRAEDRYLALLPFFHAFGITGFLVYFYHGACTAFCEGLRIKKAFTDYTITAFVAVPLILDKMKANILSHIEKTGRGKKFNFARKLSGFLRKFGIDIRRKLFGEIHKQLGGGIRLIITGAAAISKETADFYNDIGMTLIQGYGLSETAPVLSAENPENMRAGSVGKALPGVEVKIFEPDDEGIGEIIAKGPNIMLGYKDEPSPIYDGYFHTGDIGRIDSDGYIFICGRKKNVIVLPNGENVFPEEIESKINEIEGVLESVVYMTGEKAVIGAKVVYDEELTNTEKIGVEIEEINKTLAEFKKIRKIEYTVEEFVKTSTGKIKRNLI
ncbi:MAG: hypothetical protein E7394_01265 [Ruminococcaceae bacterium]|nr:hypothetical protein [Oscillospiraceae bacterium]